MKTFSAKPADVTHEWFVIDATDKVLGRVASEVALRLRGKHKAIYTPHVDTGDFIVIINAAQLRVTGAKPLDKIYYRHSGYPGGLRSRPLRELHRVGPADIEPAVEVRHDTAAVQVGLERAELELAIIEDRIGNAPIHVSSHPPHFASERIVAGRS